VLGAQTRETLLFRAELEEKLNNNLYITTGDGSCGKKGLVTDTLKKLVDAETPDCVFGCGPETMMKAVLGLCEKKQTECQLSLERYMRCAIGICGQCAINGMLVCKDGPVFNSKQLAKMAEFGKAARLKSGRLVSLREYSEWRQT
jgi:dihydroorotate dehydrogenase electron transfer subunit